MHKIVQAHRRNVPFSAKSEGTEPGKPDPATWRKSRPALETVSNNSLVTLSTYRRYINNCIYLFIYLKWSVRPRVRALLVAVLNCQLKEYYDVAYVHKDFFDYNIKFEFCDF